MNTEHQMKRRYRILLLLLFPTGLLFSLSLRCGGAPGALDRGDNGLWLTRHWLHGTSVERPTVLVERLRARGIRRVYPFLGPIDREGWPGWRDGEQIRRYPPAQAETFLREMQRLAPEIKVLPWTGGVLHRDVIFGHKGRMEGFLKHLMQLRSAGAAGVHLNVEPLPSGSPDFLRFIEEIKDALPGGLISLAAYPPQTLVWQDEEIYWSMEYLQQLCFATDELVLMSYDTGLFLGVAYEALVAHWTQTLSSLPLPNQGGCRWSMGIPSYEEEKPWHHPWAENLERALYGVLRAGALPSSFQGVTIYADWTTDDEEWGLYDRIWRGQTSAERPGPETQRL